MLPLEFSSSFLILWEKVRPEISSRKIPSKIRRHSYNKIPQHISVEGPGQHFSWKLKLKDQNRRKMLPIFSLPFSPEGKWGCTKHRRIAKCEGARSDQSQALATCSLATKYSSKTGMWSSHFLRVLSQVVGLTLWDTPVLFYTRNSLWPIGISEKTIDLRIPCSGAGLHMIIKKIKKCKCRWNIWKLIPKKNIQSASVIAKKSLHPGKLRLKILRPGKEFDNWKN